MPTNPIRGSIYAAPAFGGHKWIYEVRDRSRPERHQIQVLGWTTCWRAAVDHALEHVRDLQVRGARKPMRCLVTPYIETTGEQLPGGG